MKMTPEIGRRSGRRGEGPQRAIPRRGLRPRLQLEQLEERMLLATQLFADARDIVPDDTVNCGPTAGTLDNPFNNIQDALTCADQRATEIDQFEVVALGNRPSNPRLHRPYVIGFQGAERVVVPHDTRLRFLPLQRLDTNGNGIFEFGELDTTGPAGSPDGVLDERDLVSPAPIMVKSFQGLIELADPNSSISVDGTGQANQRILFTSLRDDTGFDGIKNTSDDLDTNQDGTLTRPRAEDWSGIFMRPASDSEASAVLYVTFRYGGGKFIHPELGERAFSPITLEDSRPVIANNYFTNNGQAAISADIFDANGDGLNSFSFSLDQPGGPAASPGGQAGVLLVGNRFGTLADEDRNGNGVVDPGEDRNDDRVLGLGNSLNALFVQLRPSDVLTHDAAFDDADIVHVLTEHLPIQNLVTLTIESGVVVKSRLSNIEVRDAARLIVNGTAQRPVVFTSTQDDFVGAGFDIAGNVVTDTDNDGINQNEDFNVNGMLDAGEDLTGDGVLTIRGNVARSGAPGQWGGLIFEQGSGDPNNDDRLRLSEDVNNNGLLDPGEDLNGDGLLQPAEDVNQNGVLDSSEDRNADGVLDAGEVSSSVNFAEIRFAGGVVPHSGSFRRFAPIDVGFDLSQTGNGGDTFVTVSNSRITNNFGPAILIDSAGANHAQVDIFRNDIGFTSPGFDDPFCRPPLAGASCPGFPVTGTRGSAISIDLDSLEIDALTGRNPFIRENRLDRNGFNGLEIRSDTNTVSSDTIFDDFDIAHILQRSVDIGSATTDVLLTVRSEDPAPIAVASGDFDRNGTQDLVVLNSAADSVSILRGTGAGIFDQRTTFTTRTDFGVTSEPRGMTVGQFNDDNRDGFVNDGDFLDVAVANFGSGDVAVLFGDGQGRLGPAESIAVSIPAQLQTMFSEDLNFDGVFNNGSSPAQPFLNEVADNVDYDRDGMISNTMVSEDLNFDGQPQFNNDLVFSAVTTGVLGNSISVAYGIGTTSDLSINISATQATLSVSFPDSNGVGAACHDGIVFRATQPQQGIPPRIDLLGRLGNEISIEYVRARPLLPTTVEVNSPKITVSLRTDLDGNIQANADEIRTAFMQSGQTLVSVNPDPACPVEMGELAGEFVRTAMSGGTDMVAIVLAIEDGTAGSGQPVGAVITTAADIQRAVNDVAGLFLSASLAPGNDGTGFVDTLPPTFLSGGISPTGVTAIVSGDFNGDGFLDLATANALSSDVSILDNQGTLVRVHVATGRFGDPVSTAAQVLARINNETSLQNLITAQLTPQDSGAPNAGSATIAGFSATPLRGGSENGGPMMAPTRASRQFAFGGQNNDLLVSARNDGIQGNGIRVEFVVGGLLTPLTIEVFNDGGFVSRPTPLALNAGETPVALAVADFNMDGNDDLAVAGRESGNLAVILADGAGGFAVPQYSSTGHPSPVSLVAAELDGQPGADIAVANRGNRSGLDRISIFRNDGAGAFAAALLVPVGDEPSGIAAGDFDRDGNFDLVVSNALGNSVSMLINGGVAADGTLSFTSPVEAARVGLSPQGIHVAKLQANGLDDVVTANIESNDLSVLFGTGDIVLHSALAVATGPDSPAVKAINLDGNPTFLTVQGQSDSLGSRIHVEGRANNPVQFTSLRDDAVARGLNFSNQPQGDTNNDGAPPVPQTIRGPLPGDWGGLRVNAFANDLFYGEDDPRNGYHVIHTEFHFAQTSLSVAGMPRHSPLLVDSGDHEGGSASNLNDAPATNRLVATAQAVPLFGSAQSPEQVLQQFQSSVNNVARAGSAAGFVSREGDTDVFQFNGSDTIDVDGTTTLNAFVAVFRRTFVPLLDSGSAGPNFGFRDVLVAFADSNSGVLDPYLGNAAEPFLADVNTAFDRVVVSSSQWEPAFLNQTVFRGGPRFEDPRVTERFAGTSIIGSAFFPFSIDPGGCGNNCDSFGTADVYRLDPRPDGGFNVTILTIPPGFGTFSGRSACAVEEARTDDVTPSPIYFSCDGAYFDTAPGVPDSQGQYTLEVREQIRDQQIAPPVSNVVAPNQIPGQDMAALSARHPDPDPRITLVTDGVGSVYTVNESNGARVQIAIGLAGPTSIVRANGRVLVSEIGDQMMPGSGEVTDISAAVECYIRSVTVPTPQPIPPNPNCFVSDASGNPLAVTLPIDYSAGGNRAVYAGGLTQPRGMTVVPKEVAGGDFDIVLVAHDPDDRDPATVGLRGSVARLADAPGGAFVDLATGVGNVWDLAATSLGVVYISRGPQDAMLTNDATGEVFRRRITGTGVTGLVDNDAGRPFATGLTLTLDPNTADTFDDRRLTLAVDPLQDSIPLNDAFNDVYAVGRNRCVAGGPISGSITKIITGGDFTTQLGFVCGLNGPTFATFDTAGHLIVSQANTIIDVSTGSSALPGTQIVHQGVDVNNNRVVEANEFIATPQDILVYHFRAADAGDPSSRGRPQGDQLAITNNAFLDQRDVGLNLFYPDRVGATGRDLVPGALRNVPNNPAGAAGNELVPGLSIQNNRFANTLADGNGSIRDQNSDLVIDNPAEIQQTVGLRIEGLNRNVSYNAARNLVAGANLEALPPVFYHEIVNNTFSLLGTDVRLLNRSWPSAYNNVFAFDHFSTTGLAPVSIDADFAGNPLVAVDTTLTVPATPPIDNAPVFGFNLYYFQNISAAASVRIPGGSAFNPFREGDVIDVDPGFLDSAQDNLNVGAMSPSVDRALSNAQDRDQLRRARRAAGLAAADLLAPMFDANEALRIDDPLVPNLGRGVNPFLDVGGLELTDFEAPTVTVELARQGCDPASPLNFNAGTPDSNVTNNRRPFLCGVVSDNSGRIANRTVQVTVTGANGTSSGADLTDQIGNYNAQVAQPLADGVYTVTARVLDEVGNEAVTTTQIVIDNAPPQVAFFTLGAAAVTIFFSEDLDPSRALDSQNYLLCQVVTVMPRMCTAITLDTPNSLIRTFGASQIKFTPNATRSFGRIRVRFFRSLDAANNPLPNQSLFVSVTGADISVRLATGAGGAVTSTVQEVTDLLNAMGGAAAQLLSAAVTGPGNDVATEFQFVSIGGGDNATVVLPVIGGPLAVGSEFQLTVNGTAANQNTLTDTSTTPPTIGVAGLTDEASNLLDAEFDEDVDFDGVRDDSEDLDNDGALDAGEDENNNQFLDSVEDRDGDMVLDPGAFLSGDSTSGGLFVGTAMRLANPIAPVIAQFRLADSSDDSVGIPNDGTTNEALPTFEGLVSKCNILVRLDVDGDGFDDGFAISDTPDPMTCPSMPGPFSFRITSRTALADTDFAALPVRVQALDRAAVESVANSLSTTTVTVDREFPRVVSVTPNGGVTGFVQEVVLTFNEELDPAVAEEMSRYSLTGLASGDQTAKILSASYSSGRLFGVQGANIVEIDSATGAMIPGSSFVAPVPPGPPVDATRHGLAFDGTNLYYLPGGSRRLFQLNPSGGAVISMADIVGGSGDFRGLAANGGLVYVLDATEDRIRGFAPGSVSASVTLDFSAASARPIDLLDGLAAAPSVNAVTPGAPAINTMFVTGVAGMGPQEIFEIDPTSASVERSFAASAGYEELDPATIADATTTTSTISVADSFRIADLNVTLDVDHPNVGELTIVLRHVPSGTTVVLLAGGTTAGSEFQDTTFDDEAATAITLGAPPYNDAFLPVTPLNALDGLNSSGDWSLEITDSGGSTVAGTLNHWSLAFTLQPVSAGSMTGERITGLASVGGRIFASSAGSTQLLVLDRRGELEKTAAAFATSALGGDGLSTVTLQVAKLFQDTYTLTMESGDLVSEDLNGDMVFNNGPGNANLLDEVADGTDYSGDGLLVNFRISEDLNGNGLFNDGVANPRLNEVLDGRDYNFDGDMVDTQVTEDLNADMTFNNGSGPLNPLLDEIADGVDYNRDGLTRNFLISEDLNGDGNFNDGVSSPILNERIDGVDYDRDGDRFTGVDRAGNALDGLFPGVLNTNVLPRTPLQFPSGDGSGQTAFVFTNGFSTAKLAAPSVVDVTVSGTGLTVTFDEAIAPATIVSTLNSQCVAQSPAAITVAIDDSLDAVFGNADDTLLSTMATLNAQGTVLTISLANCAVPAPVIAADHFYRLRIRGTGANPVADPQLTPLDGEMFEDLNGNGVRDAATEPDRNNNGVLDTFQFPSGNGVAGGDFALNFAFVTGIFVDATDGVSDFSAGTSFAANAGNLLTNPFNTIQDALRFAEIQAAKSSVGRADVIVLGNNSATAPNVYRVGTDAPGVADPSEQVIVPDDVRLVFRPLARDLVTPAPITVKLFDSLIDVSGVNAALRVERPNPADATRRVVFTSLRDDTGLDGIALTADDLDSNGDDPETLPSKEDWAGILFGPNADSENSRIIDSIFRFGGGEFDHATLGLHAFSPIQLHDARPEIRDNLFIRNGQAAIAADLASFRTVTTTAGGTITGTRIGTNTYEDSSINGLLVLIQPGEQAANGIAFDDSEIVHVLTQNLALTGAPVPLTIGAGTTIKLFNSFISVGAGSSVVARGTATNPIIITSTRDDSVGAGRTLAGENLVVALAPGNDGTGLVAALPLTSLAGGSDGPPPVAATLTTTFAGANNDLVFAARTPGAAGNSIRVRFAVAGNNSPLGLVVNGSDFIVNLATGATGAATSTAVDISNLFRAVQLDTNNDGSATTRAAGNYGGIEFLANSAGALEQVVIGFGGGTVPVTGGNPRPVNLLDIGPAARVEILSSDIHDALGPGVFVTSTAPTIFNNQIRNLMVDPTDGTRVPAAISVSPDVLGDGPDNQDVLTHGANAFIRRNLISTTLVQDPLNPMISGMEIRAGNLVTAGRWDDGDITHVLRGRVQIAAGGAAAGTLVVQPGIVAKVLGPAAGITVAVDNPLSRTAIRIGSNDANPATPEPRAVFTSLHDDNIVVTGTWLGIDGVVNDTTHLIADFETGANGFTPDTTVPGAGNLWHRTARRGNDPGHSSTTSYYYGRNETVAVAGNYATAGPNTGTLTSPAIALASVRGAIALTFNYLLQTDAIGDVAELLARRDAASPFQVIATLANTGTTFVSQTVDLTTFASAQTQVQFRLTADGVNDYVEGFFVDDVRVFSGADTPFSLANADNDFTQPLAGDWDGILINAFTNEQAATGSAVTNSDFRFGTNAITIVGLPQTGPLISGNPATPQGQLVIRDSMFAVNQQSGVTILPSAVIPGPQRLLPGARIENNVFVGTEAVGLVIQGSTRATDPIQSVEVINNTFHRNDVGVDISNFSGPTLLNNIFSQQITSGVEIDNTSNNLRLSGPRGPVLNSNLFATGALFNTADITITGLPVVVGTVDSRPVFGAPSFVSVSAAYNANTAVARDFELTRVSAAGDAARSDLPGRVTPASILAPTRDQGEQFRIDDPLKPNLGAGTTPFYDIGAFELSDFVAPFVTSLRLVPAPLMPLGDTGIQADNKTNQTRPGFEGTVGDNSQDLGGLQVCLDVDGVDSAPVSSPANRFDDGCTTTNALGFFRLATTTAIPNSPAGRAVEARVTDRAGNVGASGLTIIVDLVPPFVNTIGPIASPRNTPVSTVNVAFSEPIITATLDARDLTLRLGGGPNLITAGTPVTVSFVSGNTYQIGGLGALTTAEGTYTLSIAGGGIQDEAGNSGGGNPSTTWVMDTTPPVPPIINSITTDTGRSATDEVTFDTTLTFGGIAEPLSTVMLTQVGVGVISSAVTTAGGAWSIPIATPFTEGTFNFTATATDPATNMSGASVVLPVTVDTTAPAPSTTPDLDPASDSAGPTGTNSDNITSDTTPTFTGMAEANAIVRIISSVAGVVGQSTASATGAWSVTTVALAQTLHNITATAEDVAGNLSPVSGTLTVTIDTSIATPPAPNLEPSSDSFGPNGTSFDDITNDTTPTFDGIAEANASVEVFSNVAGLLGTTTADAGGLWVFTSGPLTQGDHNITVRATDPAGNVSGMSAALMITIDTFTGAPSVPDLCSALSAVCPEISDIGTSNTDNITNDDFPTFSGTAEANSTVELFSNVVGSMGTTTASATGSWTLTSAIDLTDGTHMIRAQATDVAGNTGAFSGALQVEIDTMAPITPPSTPDLDPASDSGFSNTDNVTNDTTPTFGGTAEPNGNVRLFDGAVSLGTAPVNASGMWTFTSGVLAEGLHFISATVTDVAGNETAPSASLQVTIDMQVAPSSTPDLAAASDTGISSSDNITLDNTPTFNGTAEAGSRVEVLSSLAGSLGTSTADGAGNWSFTFAAGLLADGVHNITARVTDVAGNISAISGALPVTIDTVSNPPSQPDMTAATDSFSVTPPNGSNSDNITRILTPTFTGSAEANSFVELLSNVDGVVGTMTASPTGAWTITSGTLTSGGTGLGTTHSVTARATDVAGNLSLGSTALVVRIDVTALPPSVPDLDPASDRGSSNSDNVTNDSTPTLTGTAEPSSVVTILDGAVGLGNTPADAVGNWTFTTASLADGLHNFSARITDSAGNVSGTSGTLPVMIDITAPAAPTMPDLIAASDSGTSNTDNLTNVTTPTFTGMAEANSTVEVMSNVAGSLGTTLASATGAWTFTSPVALANGLHLVTARATDLAGNTGPFNTNPLNLTIDTIAPAPPTALDLVPASDTGISNGDNITSDTTPTVSGSASTPPTATSVTLRSGATVLGTAALTATGSWSITSPPLADGVYPVTATASDGAGNVSLSSATLTITVDTTAPPVPSMPDLTAASDSGFSSADNITNVVIPTITGTAEPRSQVMLLDSGVNIGTATTTAAGVWTLISASLADGQHTVTAQATDEAGNVGAVSNPLIVTIDTTTPAPTVTGVINDTGVSPNDGITNDQRLVINGVAEAGSRVTVRQDGLPIGTPVTDLAGVWTLDNTANLLAPGSYNYTATSVDVAGNVSLSSATFVVVVDTTPPSSIGVASLFGPDDTGVQGDNTTRFDRPRLTGTTDPGSQIDIIDLFGTCLGGTCLGDITVADAAGRFTVQFGNAQLDGSYTVRVRATDLAGNFSEDLNNNNMLDPGEDRDLDGVIDSSISTPLQITVDTTPPVVRSVAPSGTLAASTTQVTVSFNDDNLNATTLGNVAFGGSVLNPANYSLIGSGGDGNFNSGNERFVNLSNSVFVYDATADRLDINLRDTQGLPMLLGNDSFQFTINGITSVQDVAGNSISGGNFTRVFVVAVPPPVLSDVHLRGTSKVVTHVDLTFSRSLNPELAVNAGGYALLGAGRDRLFGTPDDILVELATPVYNDQARTVTLQALRGFSANTFFQLVIDDVLTDSSGNHLDGDFSGVAGGDLVHTIARTKKALLYTDSNGDVVTLTPSRGVFAEVVRFANGEGRFLTLTPSRAGGALSGAVRRAGAGDGLTNFDTLRGTANVNLQNFRQPPFVVRDPIAAMVVDRVLDAGETAADQVADMLARRQTANDLLAELIASGMNGLK